MRQRRVLGLLAGAAALWSATALGVAGTPAAGAATTGLAQVQAGGGWGKGIVVPGLSALDNGDDAQVFSVSCGSAGNCAVAGIYASARDGEQGFVDLEQDGQWGKAIEVPGLLTLDKGAPAQAVTVSCGSAGTCAVGGHYFVGTSDRELGFVAVERNGRWSRAVQMPGQAVLAKGGSAQVTSIFCGGSGACLAGGSYNDSAGHSLGFVATEKNGRWGTAIGVPGLAALAAGGSAQVASVSCGAAGSCAVGGDYFNGHPADEQGFVATEKNGRWGTAIGVPGLTALNTGDDADVASVSCGAAGSCAVGGTYQLKNLLGSRGYVALEHNGQWGTATTIDTGLGSAVSSVSCATAAYCAAAGEYGDNSGSHMFVVSEQAGGWGTPVVVPSPNPVVGGKVTSVSCGSAGNCAIGGNYSAPHGLVLGFVAAERNGHWGAAITMPRGAASGLTGTRVFPVSCVAAGPCTAGGRYVDAADRTQGFIVTHTG